MSTSPDESAAAADTAGAATAGEVQPIEYRPDVFRRATLDAAKQIILQPGPGMTVEERWEKETGWLLDQLRFDDRDALLLDFGCGVGRLARELPNPIIGVDIAPEMRRHAEYYVDRPNFAAVAPVLLAELVRSGLRFDGGLAVWALQHAFDPEKEIAFIAGALRPGAPFWVLNTLQRCVPTEIGWVDDGKEIGALLDRWFQCDVDIPVDRDVVNVDSFLRCYRTR
jgi:SAM-dependent methyltransferase